MSNTVFKIVADRLIAELEKGSAPWRKPWSAPLAPRNFISKHRYQGINHVLLSCEVARRGCPYFGTLRQIRNVGGRVPDSEFMESSIVTFWKWIEVQDGNGDNQRVPFLRYSRVWNLTQTEGIEWSIPNARTVDPIEEYERIARGYRSGPPIISDGGDRCYYCPINDSVHTPIPELFGGNVGYYSSVFHELIHSTGHTSRLNRSLSLDKDSTSYAIEELIAEAGAAFLLGAAGIDETTNLKNNAAYLRDWMEFVQDHPRCVVTAFSQAQKAADWVLGKRKSERVGEKYDVAA